jgi:hypothetical protein
MIRNDTFADRHCVMRLGPATGHMVAAIAYCRNDEVAAELVSAVNSVDSLQAENERLKAALGEIEDEASSPQQMYDRIGPTWTGKDGNEYEDTSAFLSKCNLIAEIARAVLGSNGNG